MDSLRSRKDEQRHPGGILSGQTDLAPHGAELLGLDGQGDRTGPVGRFHPEGEHQRIRRHGRLLGLRLYVEQENDAARRTYASVGMRDAGYRLLAETFERAPS